MTYRFDHDEARALRALGWTQTQIASKFGVSRCAIQYALKGMPRPKIKPEPVERPRVSFWTPWFSSCLAVPQLDSGPPLPTRGAAHGHVHTASKRRVHRRANNDTHQGGNS